jgi:hypothetical protein
LVEGVAIVALDGSGHRVRNTSTSHPPHVCLFHFPSLFFHIPYTQHPLILSQIVTTEKKGWFYHRALPFDVNHDGIIDIVTARATSPGKDQQVPPRARNETGLCFTILQGELIVLLGPSFQTEKVLVSGPDFLFRIFDFAGDASLQVIAAEFYSKQLMYYRFDPRTLTPTTSVLDAALGAGFDCQVTDINNDGRPDVLATNHEPSGSVFAFEVSVLSNLTAVATKHTLASNITIHKSVVPSPGAAAPGEATAFPPPNEVRQPNALLAWLCVIAMLLMVTMTSALRLTRDTDEIAWQSRFQTVDCIGWRRPIHRHDS